MEVERPKPSPYAEPEQHVFPWRAAPVLFAFTLPITGALEPVQWIVGMVGAAVVLFLLIGWPLAYVGEKALAPIRD